MENIIADHKKVRKLLKKDRVMYRLAFKYGELEWGRSYGYFYDLTYSIVSQQLSDKAASTIFTRFKKLLGRKKLNAKNVIGLDLNDMRKSGISASKAGYIKNLAKEVESRNIILSELGDMGDEMVIDKLVKVKGIGRWTAEMFLIFSLDRQDVFSVGDLGLRKAVSMHYGVERDDHKKILEIARSWKPYRSWASRYLWKSLDSK